MFEVVEANCTLVHKNDRLEKHGEESVLACDLNFEWETTNGMLSMFAPDLRSCLYKRQDSAQMELEPDPEHVTALRFPGMGVIKWGLGELVGAELTFHYGLKSKLELDAKKVHKYRIECKEGGAVVIGFQVQCHPTEQQAGKLSKFLQDGMVVVSVTPPAAGDGDVGND